MRTRFTNTGGHRIRWTTTDTAALLALVVLGLTFIGLVRPAPAEAQQPSSPVRIMGTDATTGRPAAVTAAGGTLYVANVGTSNPFAAQSGTGQTATFDPKVVPGNHSIQLVVTGSPTGCTYRLQGSNDGTNWYNISAADITCTSTTQAYEQNKPARLLRGNLLTLSGGSSPTVTLIYAGQ